MSVLIAERSEARALLGCVHLFRTDRSSVMRVVVSVLVSALLVGCAGPKRTTQGVPTGADDSSAPIGTSSITVKASVPADSAFPRAAALLQRRGYGIGNSNSQLKTLTTTWRTLNTGIGPKVSTRLSLGIVSSSPTSVRVSGTYRASDFSSENIRKRGQSGSPAREAWAEMLSVTYHVSEEVDGRLLFNEVR